MRVFAASRICRAPNRLIWETACNRWTGIADVRPLAANRGRERDWSFAVRASRLVLFSRDSRDLLFVPPAAPVGGTAVTSVPTSRREAARLAVSRAPGGLL